MNAIVPSLAAARYRGVPSVVYSTGNVYPFRPMQLGGATEATPPAPIGDYAQSCLAREQVFRHAATTWGTPVLFYRLNYAVELRYGVIADVATKIAAGQPVDVTMPAANVVWQGDSNRWTLRSLALAHPETFVLNATGPETLSIRGIATRLGEVMDAEVTFTGTEAPDALLNDASLAHQLFGYPTVSARQAIDWVGRWVAQGGRQLGKATKFEQRGGQF